MRLIGTLAVLYVINLIHIHIIQAYQLTLAPFTAKSTYTSLTIEGFPNLDEDGPIYDCTISFKGSEGYIQSKLIDFELRSGYHFRDQSLVPWNEDGAFSIRWPELEKSTVDLGGVRSIIIFLDLQPGTTKLAIVTSFKSAKTGKEYTNPPKIFLASPSLAESLTVRLHQVAAPAASKKALWDRSYRNVELSVVGTSTVWDPSIKDIFFYLTTPGVSLTLQPGAIAPTCSLNGRVLAITFGFNAQFQQYVITAAVHGGGGAVPKGSSFVIKCSGVVLQSDNFKLSRNYILGANFVDSSRPALIITDYHLGQDRLSYDIKDHALKKHGFIAAIALISLILLGVTFLVAKQMKMCWFKEKSELDEEMITIDRRYIGVN